MTHNPSLVPQPNAPYERLGFAAPPAMLRRLSTAHTPWFETIEDIRAGLEYGRKNARLLEWVRSQMRLRLSRVERRCIELYFFDGLNYRQCADALEVNVTSVYRGVQRALRKLRKAAKDFPPDAAKDRRKKRSGRSR